METFSVGDQVSWNPAKDLSGIHMYVKKYGKGPFKILSVQDAEVLPGHLALHPQTLTLEVHNGVFKHTVFRLGTKMPAPISGAWLVKVPLKA